MTSRRRGI